MRVLSYKQQSSILAGLRLLQNAIEAGELESHSLVHFSDVEALSDIEIDKLCEEISLKELAITP
jgi:hypothetical protein